VLSTTASENAPPAPVVVDAMNSATLRLSRA
jgi:hypothetical protein